MLIQEGEPFRLKYCYQVEYIVTVGYGDLYPVTLGGKIVAAMLMVVGIAILGTTVLSFDYILLSRTRMNFQICKALTLVRGDTNILGTPRVSCPARVRLPNVRSPT